MENLVKKNVVDDQKSPFASKNLELKTEAATVENKSAEEMPPTDTDESFADQSQSQAQVQNIDGPLNDLPPEILLEILENLDAPSLFACRLVNRQFNSISSEILWIRWKVELGFRNVEGKLMFVKKGKTLKEKSLQDFVECMNQSEKCPFARFSFGLTHFSLPQLDYFFSQFDVTRINCLKLSFAFWNTGAGFCSISDLTEKLGDLLLNKIPHLEEFGLSIPSAGAHELKLFSSSSSNSIQLSHLKVLRFDPYMFSSYPKIVRDLSTAAVNLERIYSFSGDSFNLSVSDFCFIHSLGKPDCLQHLRICPTSYFIREMKGKLPDLPNLLNLNKLELSFSRQSQIQRGSHFLSDVPNFLSALFHSSKNILESLEMEQLGFLPNLQFPRLTKLERLILNQDFEDGEDVEKNRLFPPRVKSLDIFPAVRDLDYRINHWEVPFPAENSISRLPNVQSIRLYFCYELANLPYRIQHLSSICPNVRHLEIVPDLYGKSPHRNFLQVGRTIATHLPKLESLELFFDVDLAANNSHAIDSCFTGFSEDNCKRLFDSAFDEVVKKRDSNSDSDDKINQPEFEFDSQSELIPEREHPSIFDIKNLKKLTVNPLFDRKLLERKCFTEKLTWISKKYSLDLMPQLKITGAGDNINYRLSPNNSPPSTNPPPLPT